jgi:DNA-binding Xre family transcriptional regulator
MWTKFIEATQDAGGGMVNWGKFQLLKYENEWKIPSMLPGPSYGLPLLRQCGWSHRHMWVLDCQTGEGALILPGGSARADLMKHRIWVCPLFEPFLIWLYAQDLNYPADLPAIVELPTAEFSFQGYRRPGPVLREIISINVRRELGIRRWKQRKLARAAGISETIVSNVVHQATGVSLESLMAIAMAFGVSVEALIR